jgi:uncharacterized protein with GYD domain
MKVEDKDCQLSDPTISEMQKLFEQGAKEGKILGFYFTLGGYDGVVISEPRDEKAHMKHMLRFSEFVSTETLVAVPAEEASKLVE